MYSDDNLQSVTGLYESTSSDDDWMAWYADYGRVQIVNHLGQVKRPLSGVFSNVIIHDSMVNGLSTFEPLNEFTLPAELVSIQKLILTNKVQEEGTVMLAIGERETASIYLGEQQVSDVVGSKFVAASMNVIGTITALRGSYGTIHPESIQAYNGLLFWYDHYSGAVVQYGANGLVPISSNKADSFFLRNARNNATGLRIAMVDEEFGEYQLYLPQTTLMQGNHFDDGRGKVVVYDFINNKWRAAYTFKPDAGVMFNNVLFMFKDGKPHVTDVTATEAIVFGVALKARITYLETSDARLAVKTWSNIALVSTKQPDYVKIETRHPDYQVSELDKFCFREVEGRYYAPILRDMNSLGFADASKALISGQKMRGDYVIIQLEYSEEQTVEKFYLIAAYTGHEFSIGHIQ